MYYIKTDLWDPSGEGGCTFCPSPPSWGDCPWFGPEIRGPSRSAIATAVAIAHIATIKTLLKLIPAPGLGTVVPCTLSIPGRWAGPAIREIEMKWGRYYTLLRITTYPPIARIMKEVLSFPVFKWNYIRRTFFSQLTNGTNSQRQYFSEIRGSILVKSTGRCSCSGCTFQIMF